jgi:hypothetical protein
VAARTSIPIVWLKGAALAWQHPAGFGVRGMGDLDVLVPSEAALELHAALRAAGWRGDAADASYAQHHHLPPLSHGDDVRVELHTGLLMPGHPFRSADGRDWLARAGEVTTPEGTVRVLPPVWHLVYAALHWAWASEAMIGSWQWLHDAEWLGSLIGGAEGWQGVKAAAADLGSESVVGWALWFAAAHGVGGIPTDVINALRARRVVGDAVLEREWVARAWVGGGAVRSVRWTRLLWRRSLGAVARDPRRLPWALGRGALTGG